MSLEQTIKEAEAFEQYDKEQARKKAEQEKTIYLTARLILVFAVTAPVDSEKKLETIQAQLREFLAEMEAI